MLQSNLNMSRIFEIGGIFGLEKDEVDLYVLALLNDGQTASEISRISNYDRTKCYRVITKLEEMGLIQKSISMPSKIFAKKPVEVLQLIMDEKKIKLDIMKELRQEFIELLKITSSENVFTVTSANITGYDNYLAYMIKIIRKSKRCMVLVSEMSVKRGLVSTLPDVLQKTESTVIGNFPTTILSRFKAKHIKNIPYNFEVVVTDDDVIIEVGDTKNIHSSTFHEKRNYMHTNSPFIIQIVKSFMENLYGATML